MKTIEEKTRVNGKACITFTPRTSQRQYIQFVSGSGCHTPVGMGYGSSSVTLGRGCLRIGTIMHEINHALGTWHEQSRHDRDNYVTIDFSNIQSGREHNFVKYSLGTIDELGEPYDYESVMHYSAYAFANNRQKPTIIPKQRGAVIGQRTHLSPIDIQEMQILYGCIPRPTSTGGVVTQAPFVPTNGACTFDKGMCGWTNEPGTLTWAVREGKTPSINTGPDTDHSGSPNGHYLYVEASGHPQQSAFITSPEYGAGQYCLDFYFDMYGHAMGYLKVFARTGNTRQLVHEISGDQGQRWSRYRVNINVPSGSFRIELEGHVGTSYTSDIAIDDIVFHQGKC
ncbi:meprin A subunit beta-like [Patella vulgata]|uniref:meprin A subunit beta-like n=1 Tax=Patella vulgata TaxID=6465 RepID=UPI00218068A7|nr:meprin A subunit beta-like [Patella vulgata]